MKRKDKYFKRSVAISLALHMLPLVLMLFLGGGGNGKKGDKDGKGNGSPKDNGDIAPKPSEQDKPTEIEIVEIKGPLKKPKPVIPHEKDDCIQSYGGIGIMHSPYDNTVIDAPQGYPASNAGIKVGDHIITPVESLRGEPGTEVEVTFSNEDGLHTVTLVRDKICTFEVKPTFVPEQ